MTRPTLITFLGSLGPSPVEEMVTQAHRAIAQDTLERAQSSGAFGGAIVVTDRPQGLEGWALVEPSPEPFHFGESLRSIIQKYRIEKPFYVGGGALPLLPGEELGRLAEELASAENTVITNNYYSADMLAFTPGSAIQAVSLPGRDNPLARLLVEQAGLKKRCLPRSAATQFDIDTPTDILILQAHPGAGPRARAYVESLNLDASRLRQALSLFADPQAEVLIAGRVGSYLWARLEADTACRIRLLSEERGLRGDGREEEARGSTILGFYLEQVGLGGFFHTLARLGDAAFLDSRVLFQHLRLQLTTRERFLSDLGWSHEIGHPFLRDFTRAALEAPIPVILGGHSLVAGGLLALIEAAHLRSSGQAGPSSPPARRPGWLPGEPG